jgi:hypothetical protein
MKKANMIIIGMILVILILLLFTKNCKKHEGFAESIVTPDVNGVPGFGTVSLDGDKLTTTMPLTTENVLADTNNINTAKYCAFIDNDILKIAKNVSGIWKVIWRSELSDSKWKGTSVAFANEKITIGAESIGSATGGTGAKLTSNGDLVIVKAGDVIVWSLVSQELQSSKTQLDEYLNRGSRIYESIELVELKKKLINYNEYINAVAPTDNVQSDNLKKAHEMIVQVRHQMDFDLAELNGVANSKVVSSQNGLNSSLYANLMATTLVAGLFILIATR